MLSSSLLSLWSVMKYEIKNSMSHNHVAARWMDDVWMINIYNFIQITIRYMHHWGNRCFCNFSVIKLKHVQRILFSFSHCFSLLLFLSWFNKKFIFGIFHAKFFFIVNEIKFNLSSTHMLMMIWNYKICTRFTHI